MAGGKGKLRQLKLLQKWQQQAKAEVNTPGMTLPMEKIHQMGSQSWHLLSDSIFEVEEKPLMLISYQQLI